MTDDTQEGPGEEDGPWAEGWTERVLGTTVDQAEDESFTLVNPVREEPWLDMSLSFADRLTHAIFEIDNLRQANDCLQTEVRTHRRNMNRLKQDISICAGPVMESYAAPTRMKSFKEYLRKEV